jgi:DNA-binding beta-propeller fold protein YncE
MPKPRHIEIDARDNVIVLDTAGRVLVYDHRGQAVRQWDMPTNEAGNPEGTCALKDGRIAVADTHYSRVVFFDRDGKVLSTLGIDGPDAGQFRYPVSIVQDDDENIYVCEYGGNDRVQKFTPDGQFILAFGGNGTQPGQFQRASGMIYRDGKIYIADAINNRIQVFDTDGRFIAILGGEDAPALNYPYDLCLCPDGTLLVIEYGAARITRLSLDGTVLGRFGGPGRGMGKFATPWSIGIDSQGLVRVADTGNHRIVEFQL